MGSDFFFLSEKLKIHNKKRHCGKYRFQDFKPDLFERVQERMLAKNTLCKNMFVAFGRIHAKISTWAREARTAVHLALTVKFLFPYVYDYARRIYRWKTTAN